jgi:hypothetical protein
VGRSPAPLGAAQGRGTRPRSQLAGGPSPRRRTAGPRPGPWRQPSSSPAPRRPGPARLARALAATRRP